MAKCPTHDDRSASLLITERDDGSVGFSCFAGCDNDKRGILLALGLDWADVFPERLTDHGKPHRRPFNAADALRAIAFEALVVCAGAASILAGTFPANERERLMLAAERIQSALSAAGVHRV
jgi:hypothetical protein